MIHGSNDLRAPDVAWVLRGRLACRHRPLPRSQVRPLRHPACPRPGSRRTPHLESACAAFPAKPCPRHSRLCYSFALRRFSLPLHGRAQQSLRISSRLFATPSPCAALGCFAFPSRTLLCYVSPLRCRAGLRRRPANLGGALPSPCHASLCLGHALPRFAFASPRTSKPSLRCPYRSIAVACRGFASP